MLPGNIALSCSHLDQKADPIKPIDLSSQVDETVYEQVCMALEVMPNELGLRIGNLHGIASGHRVRLLRNLSML